MSNYWKKISIVGLFIFFFAVILLLSRNLGSGVILGEPDEFVHAQLSQNLLRSPIPTYSGAPFFYDLPGMFVTGSLVLRFVKDPLVSVRLVSFLSTTALGLLIYYYLRKRGVTVIGSAVGGLLFYFNPLTIFYSQVGVIEPLLSLFLFSFLVFYDLFLEKNLLRYSALAGVFLALAIFTKYTALYFLLLALLVFAYKSLRASFSLLRLKSGYLLLDFKSLVPLAIVAVTVVPVVFFFYSKFPAELKFQTRQVLGFTSMAVFSPFINLDADFFGKLFWWFPIPMLVGTLLGFIAFLDKFRQKSLFCLASFLILFVLVSSRAPFYPRYLVVLLPYIAVFSAVFLDYSVGFLPLPSRMRGALLILVLVLYIVTYRNIISDSYLSSKHNLLETAAASINKNPANSSKWVLSNYWPNIVGSRVGRQNYAWLTLDNREISIFQPTESKTGLEIMKEGRAVMVIENIYSNFLVYPPARYEALTKIKRELRPDLVITDPSSNFPFFKDSVNRVDIYTPLTL